MKPVVTTVTLVTEDGVPIDAVHLPGPDPGAGQAAAARDTERDLAIVMAHGFTQSWQRPMVWRIAQRLNRAAAVVTFDFRGHGRSGGLSTLGDKEINDLDVAVRYARELGYRAVVTVGFSMGASVVLRQAALRRGVDAVVAVSGPGRWFYRETEPMRRVHFAAEKRLGRLIARHFLNTRISPNGWPTPDPMPPAEAAAKITPVPLLIVHGDKDIYFPPDHGRQLYDAASEPKEFWLIPGFGHAERHTDDALTDRIATWIATAAVTAAHAGTTAHAGTSGTTSIGGQSVPLTAPAPPATSATAGNPPAQPGPGTSAGPADTQLAS